MGTTVQVSVDQVQNVAISVAFLGMFLYLLAVTVRATGRWLKPKLARWFVAQPTQMRGFVEDEQEFEEEDAGGDEVEEEYEVVQQKRPVRRRK